MPNQAAHSAAKPQPRAALIARAARKRAAVLLFTSAAMMLTGPAHATSAASTTAPASTASSSNWNNNVSRNNLGAHMIGNPAAKVKLIEYFSYTCSHCADFARDADGGLHKDYVAKGLVQVEYRNLVRDSIDVTAALLARCGAASAFYGNHKALMASQQSWSENLQKANAARQKTWAEGSIASRATALAADSGMMALMKSRGYTQAQLNSCLSSEAALESLQAMSNQGRAVDKVTGTPSFFLNGKSIGSGNWTMVKTNLDAALNGA